MAFDPRLTSYQIPFQPLFDTTQRQIQRSLFALQEKLRRRKQIDLEMKLQLQSELSKTAGLPFQQTYYQALRDMEERDLAKKSAVDEQVYRQQIFNDVNHLNRIQELRFQRDQLKREAALSANSLKKAENVRFIDQISSPSDQELIRRYEDGSKAKEYYKDMQKQIKKQDIQVQKSKAQFQRERAQRQKNMFKNQQQKLKFYSDRKNEGILGLQSAKQPIKELYKQPDYTPYDYIKQLNQAKKKQNASGRKQKNQLAKELKKQFDKVQQQQQPKHVQSLLRLPNESVARQSVSPVRFLVQKSVTPSNASPYKQLVKRYKSMGKMPCNRSRSNLSPHKTSVLNESYLKARETHALSRPSMQQIQFQAIKKIQNRLKVSKVIYEDSQFRNNKYEANHLFNTFQIELRQRNQVRDKINGHPLVLRKHAMVVE